MKFSHVTTWMNFKGIMLSKKPKSDGERDQIPYDFIHMSNLKEIKGINKIKSTSKLRYRYPKLWFPRGEGAGGVNEMGDGELYKDGGN